MGRFLQLGENVPAVAGVDVTSQVHDICSKVKRAAARDLFQKHMQSGTYSSLDGSELPESAQAHEWKAALAREATAVQGIHGAQLSCPVDTDCDRSIL